MKLIPVLLVSMSLCTAARAFEGTTLATGADKALAVVSGELHVPGLHQSVRVLRDQWGVAHIYAQNQHDLFFAQGVVAAQDRLFQMELWKRAGQGRLSEILGPTALQARYQRARPAVPGRHAEGVRELLSRYSGDPRRRSRTALTLTSRALKSLGQFRHAHRISTCRFRPDFWQPQDCLNRMAAFSMTGNAASELNCGARAHGTRRGQGREVV